MSSALQSVLTSLQQNNCVTRRFIFSRGDQFHKLALVAVLTAVGYDYGELYAQSRYDILTCRLSVLTFSDEVSCCMLLHTGSLISHAD